ncbi:MAG: antibiotic biosynthesis monooxygenase [Actinomycetota bacterium]
MEQTQGHFASGNWHVKKGEEEKFVERWTEFLRWTRETQPALVSASLIRDEKDPAHFVSFAEWKTSGGRDGWREAPGFSERFSACRALCDDFYGGDYGHLVAV